MSLTFEQFMAASKRWDEMEKRLVKLFGFNPAISNHYGTIQLYNQRINESTTDEEIMNIRTAYLQWKDNILSFFEKQNPNYELEQIEKLFRVDSMFGTLSFLEIPVDIYGEMEQYYSRIQEFLSKCD